MCFHLVEDGLDLCVVLFWVITFLMLLLFLKLREKVGLSFAVAMRLLFLVEIFVVGLGLLLVK